MSPNNGQYGHQQQMTSPRQGGQYNDPRYGTPQNYGAQNGYGQPYNGYGTPNNG